jgi:exopolysaccharide biosynthesis polyprenyl glycosylphosphotransferase
LLEVSGHTFRIDEVTQLILVGSALCSLGVGYRLLDLYQSQRTSSLWSEGFRIAAANLVAFVLLLAIAFAFGLTASNRLQMGFFVVLNAAVTIALHLGIRGSARAARRRGYNFRHLLLISAGEQEPTRLIEKLSDNEHWGYRIAGVATRSLAQPPRPADALALEEAPRMALQHVDSFLDETAIDEIWVDGLPEDSSPVYAAVANAWERGVSTRYILAGNFIPGVRWGFENFDTITTLAATRNPRDELAVVSKRCMDVILASLALIAVSPLLVVVTLALWCTRAGPILFRQERVGLAGRRFTLYKFRSMVADAEQRLASMSQGNQLNGPIFKMNKDPRVTRLGGILRVLSIDELPQLLNVLRGEMSLVGPRPPLPSEVHLYQRQQRRRLSVRPGITGLWQVSGRNNIREFEKRLELDLRYIDQWSLWMDCSILLRTIPAVLSMRGARGVPPQDSPAGP